MKDRHKVSGQFDGVHAPSDTPVAALGGRGPPQGNVGCIGGVPKGHQRRSVLADISATRVRGPSSIYQGETEERAESIEEIVWQVELPL